MTKISFTTTGAWDQADGFGCASLGLAGVCGNEENRVVSREIPAESVTLTGTYAELLTGLREVKAKQPVYAAIILFGNAGGENAFMAKLNKELSCPIVGGGAAIDPATGKKALLTGGGEGALLLFTDDRYTYTVRASSLREKNLRFCAVETEDDLRTIVSIDGRKPGEFFWQYWQSAGLAQKDFEHLTLADEDGVCAHLSEQDGVYKSGRDLCPTMKLVYMSPDKVYDGMRAFYDEDDAIVFGCAGLGGLLKKPLDTKSLGLFLFGEVCTVREGKAEFGNLMLSKLTIRAK